MCAFFAAIGLWETQEFDNILDTLHDGSNPKAKILLTKLQKECHDYVLENRLKEHLELYRDSPQLAGLADMQLIELQVQRDSGNPENYNKLLRNYIDTQAIQYAKNVTWKCTYSTSLTIGITVLALGVAYFSTGPFGLLAIPAALALGYLVYKAWSYYTTKKIAKALAAVTNDQIPDLIPSINKPSLKLTETKSLYHHSSPAAKLLISLFLYAHRCITTIVN